MKFRFFLLVMIVLWSRLGFAVENGEPFTLEQAMQTAIANHPELKALSEEARAVKTQTSQARYWEDTMVGVRFYQVPFSGGFDQTQDIDYIMRQRFPIGGKPKAQAKQAYHDYQHHLHDVQLKALEILKELKRTYYELYAVQRLLGVNREMEGNLRIVVNNAQGRIAVNQAPGADSSLGQTEIANILTQRPALQQRKMSLEAKLRELTVDQTLREVKLPAKVDVPDWDASLEELFLAASLRHPELLGGEHMIEAKEWGVKVAKRDYFPELNVQTEYVQRPGGRVDAFTGELMLNVPLIVRKKNLQVKEAEAKLAGAQYTYQAEKNKLKTRVEQAFYRMKSAEQVLALNRGTVLPQARQAFQLTSTAYGAGKTGFPEVLASVRMLLEANGNYWEAYIEHADAVFELEASVGLSREEFEALRKSGALAERKSS